MNQGRNPMRKGSWTGHMHSHLSKRVRTRRGLAPDSGGDSARKALWMRDGGDEGGGRERTRPNEGEMCQSGSLSSSGPEIPHGPARRSLASLPAVRYQTRSRPHSCVSLSAPPLLLLAFLFRTASTIRTTQSSKLRSCLAGSHRSFYDTIPFLVFRLVR
jgi:hypothetical protein